MQINPHFFQRELILNQIPSFFNNQTNLKNNNIPHIFKKKSGLLYLKVYSSQKMN